MDWDMAIERCRVPLLGVVMALCARIGLTEGANVERLSKPLYRFMLSQLRKAESAARRLIFAAARNIVLEPPAERPARVRSKVPPKDKAKVDGEAKDKAQRRPSFGLFDPPKRNGRRFKKKHKGPEPRITYFDYDPRIPEFLRAQFMAPAAVPSAPVVAEKVDDGMVSAKRLVRRFLAILDALQDIKRQAMRLARWEARPKEDRRPERWSPLRPGKPPGYRERPKHEVEEILKECDWIARNVMPPIDDTS